MKRKVIVVVAGLALVAGVAVIWQWAAPRWRESDSVIRVSGNMEVTAVELSFRIPGWVRQRHVDEGWQVRAGRTEIARLDDVELQHEVAQREAELANARAALAELEAGSRPDEKGAAKATVDRAAAALAELQAGSRPEEISAAQAAVQAAQAEMERSGTEFDRLKTLYEKGVTTAQEFDNARSARQAAQARLDEAQAKLKLVKEGPRREQIDQAAAALADAQHRCQLVLDGPRKEQIDQAAARARQLEQVLGLARTRLGFCTLTSPVTGVVLSKNTEAGEFVAAGTPIVTVADLREIWLRAYIDEPDLKRVKTGQRATILTDSGDRYEGVVTFIAQQAEFTPKNVQTRKERVKLVYRIKITVPNPRLELKPGMPADAEIDVNSPPVALGPAASSPPAATSQAAVQTTNDEGRLTSQ
jgi:HlyD family secretion protein